MKKNILIGMVAGLGLALIASAAMAWGPGYGGGLGYGPRYGSPPISNLTAEQTTKIRDLQQAQLKDTAPLQQQLLAKRTELRAAWLSQSPDQAKITGLQKDILTLRGQLQDKATNASFEMRKVLTPEQQAQLAAYGPGMGYGMGGRMGRW
jgi:Spy/CpxP family protein refolding chaperone